MSRSHGRSPPLGAAKASGLVPWNGATPPKSVTRRVGVRGGEADHPRLGRRHAHRRRRRRSATSAPRRPRRSPPRGRSPPPPPSPGRRRGARARRRRRPPPPPAPRRVTTSSGPRLIRPLREHGGIVRDQPRAVAVHPDPRGVHHRPDRRRRAEASLAPAPSSAAWSRRASSGAGTRIGCDIGLCPATMKGADGSGGGIGTAPAITSSREELRLSSRGSRRERCPPRYPHSRVLPSRGRRGG